MLEVDSVWRFEHVFVDELVPTTRDTVSAAPNPTCSLVGSLARPETLD
jgi:hypothetical protein